METRRKRQHFVFNALPFGVSVAAYIFTKVTRVLINKWRNQGIRIVMYLDDGLGGDVGYEKHRMFVIYSNKICMIFYGRRKMPMGACEIRLHGLAMTGI